MCAFESRINGREMGCKKAHTRRKTRLMTVRLSNSRNKAPQSLRNHISHSSAGDWRFCQNAPAHRFPTANASLCPTFVSFFCCGVVFFRHRMLRFCRAHWILWRYTFFGHMRTAKLRFFITAVGFCGVFRSGRVIKCGGGRVARRKLQTMPATQYRW